MTLLSGSRRSLTRRRLAGLLTGAGAASLLAACAPSGPATPTAAPKPFATPKPVATPAVKARTPWKQAVVPIITESMFMIMGKEKGYFEEQGIDVEFTQIQDGATATKALIAGEFDSGNPGAAAAFAAMEQGAPLKTIGSVLSKVAHILYAKKEVKTLEDLYGKTVGVGASGTFLHQLITGAMRVKGLDPNKANYANVGSTPDTFPALAAGKVDAAVSAIEFQRDLSKYPDLYAMLSFAEVLPNYIRDAIPVHEKTLADRKDLTNRAMTAMVKGARFALENKGEFVALAKKMTGRDDETLGFVHDQYVKLRLVEPNFTLSPEAVAYTQQIAVDAGQMKTVQPYEKVMTDEVTKAVIATLGTWRYK